MQMPIHRKRTFYLDAMMRRLEEDTVYFVPQV